MKTKGIYFLYRVLQTLAIPALLLFFLFRCARNPLYFKSLRERLGFLPRSYKQTVAGAIWLHAVSVGEVLAVVELARRLRAEFPRTPLFVSTTTLAGRAAGAEKLAGLTDGVFFAPVDHVFAVRSVLRTLQPSVVVVAETEVWPNLFREAKRAGCGLVIVNGRISDRTARRYARSRWFFRHVMRWPDTVLAQSGAIEARYLAMGTPEERLRIGGNLKYDFVPRALDASSPARRFIERLKPDEVWVAASTMPPAAAGDVDEDEAVIEAFASLSRRRQGLLLVLAPRKPERFDIVAGKLARAGVPFVRRSSLASLELPGVLLLDSIGELGGLFPMADLVFMGGTLAARGGHNILEPALFERAVISGPHMENFREIAEEFRASGACLEIDGPAELEAAVEELLSNRARAAEIGRRALTCAQARRGATERALEAIREAADISAPLMIQPLGARMLLGPLSLIWRAANARNLARRFERRRRLAAGVISVGNIVMGGTGKTPVVVYLANKLQEMGRKPGILSRGYGRQSLDRHLVLEPGARVQTTQSGDEPQIFLRAANVPVAIGADRFETGWLLEDRFGADVMILDDGFQHLQLERQVDIVLIDALRPFGGGEVFPLGSLREPLEALARADVLIVTRVNLARSPAGLERALSRYNQRAPVFRSRLVPLCWVEEPGGRERPLSALVYDRLAAFCGLGNPMAFWSTLELLGFNVTAREAFADHHFYRPEEIRRLSKQFTAAGAQAVVTTEKDAVNLSEGASTLMAPLPLYWLKTAVEIDREAELLEFIEERLRAQPRASTAWR